MSSAPKSADQRVARGDATRTQILESAREVLAADGYSGASTRAVAERAGVQLSLVHYHFGGKQGLLAAVLAHENEQLLARQQKLYAKDEPLAEKWRTACAYLRRDLRSGYVRILWELWAAGLTDPDLARRWREAMREWRSLLERARRFAVHALRQVERSAPRYSLFTGGIGTAIFAARCLEARADYPTIDSWD